MVGNYPFIDLETKNPKPNYSPDLLTNSIFKGDKQVSDFNKNNL